MFLAWTAGPAWPCGAFNAKTSNRRALAGDPDAWEKWLNVDNGSKSPRKRGALSAGAAYRRHVGGRLREKIVDAVGAIGVRIISTRLRHIGPVLLGRMVRLFFFYVSPLLAKIR